MIPPCFRFSSARTPPTGHPRVALQQFHNVLGDLAAGRDTAALRHYLVAAYVQWARAELCCIDKRAR
jgi:hypothetical protein